MSQHTASARLATLMLASTALVSACQSPYALSPDSEPSLVERGERLFFQETFEGNGRTCGTCHRLEENFTISPAFIATLPDDDPLFVAEFDPALAENFEKPEMMRQFGLILENLNGFDDLEDDFVLRGVPHVLSLRTSVESPAGPRTGWSGDGSHDGSLRGFATAAVIQHFPRTLAREPGVDFRAPAEDELDALEAYMLSLGRPQDPDLPLPLRGRLARRGQSLFLSESRGKCNVCHVNAGAQAILRGENLGNANFNTGVEAIRVVDGVPADDGFGSPGDGSFNTPPLVEAADSAPFFHNNSVETLEEAIAFYREPAFNDSPAGKLLANLDPDGEGIRLRDRDVEAIGAFLRVINALENMRVSDEILRRSIDPRTRYTQNDLVFSAAQVADAISVLNETALHPRAVAHLRKAERLTRLAHESGPAGGGYVRRAISEQERAAELLMLRRQARRKNAPFLRWDSDWPGTSGWHGIQVSTPRPSL